MEQYLYAHSKSQSKQQQAATRDRIHATMKNHHLTCHVMYLQRIGISREFTASI